MLYRFCFKEHFLRISSYICRWQGVIIVLFPSCVSIVIAYKNPTPDGVVGFDYNTYGNYVMMIILATVLSVSALLISYYVYYFNICNCWGIKYICNALTWFGKNTIVILGFDLMLNRLCTSIIMNLHLKGLFIITLKLAFDAILILGWTCLKGILNRLDLITVG